MTTTIPRIIHQTWKNAEVPPRWQGFARSWRAQHPGWEYRLWTDTDNRAFIAQRVPDFLATFERYRYGILRADAVPGFVFFPGWDSPGNDIDNAGRDIPQTARACAGRRDAVCFNTDGFLKPAVRPRAEWLAMGDGNDREGLYVKAGHVAGFDRDAAPES